MSDVHFVEICASLKGLRIRSLLAEGRDGAGECVRAEVLLEVSERDRELHNRQTRIDQLSHEIAILKPQQFGQRSERLNSEQMSLLEEAIDGDEAAIEKELEQPKPPSAERQREQPKCAPLPPQPPRTNIHHESYSTVCHCGCERVRFDEDVGEKLDYAPGSIYAREAYPE